MRPGATFGFHASGAVAAGICISTEVAVHLVDLGAFTPPWPLMLRSASLLLLAVGAVTVEALWRVRPWAFRAALLMTVCYAAFVTVAGVVSGRPEVLSRALTLLGVGVAGAVPMLWHLHALSRRLWPRAGVRVAATQP